MCVTIWANAASYTLTPSEIGKAITVTVSYTDGAGTAESKASSPTALVAGSTTPTTDPTLASFIAAFDNKSASMVGDVELNGVLYVLRIKPISTTDYRTDPDGSKSYLTSVIVTKIGNGQILAQNEIAQLYSGGLDSSANNGSALIRGTISAVNGGIKVFFSEKKTEMIYEIKRTVIHMVDCQCLVNLKLATQPHSSIRRSKISKILTAKSSSFAICATPITENEAMTSANCRASMISSRE